MDFSTQALTSIPWNQLEFQGRGMNIHGELTKQSHFNSNLGVILRAQNDRLKGFAWGSSHG